MLISDEEAKHLKVWVIKKLEDISDADSDVLADYALALIRAEAPEAQLRVNTTENLEDFLRENTASFVDGVFEVLRNKSYLPDYIPSSTTAIPLAQPIPTFSTDVEGTRGGKIGGVERGPRKRSFNEVQQGFNGQDSQRRDDRQLKHMRRGGLDQSVRDGYGRAAPNVNALPPPQTFPGATALPGPMSFDPNDPMAAILAMQAMGIPLPTNGAAPSYPSGQSSQNTGKNRVNARCRDYDTKGICTRGVACPFNHGDNQIIIPPSPTEYDPKTPGLIDFPMQLSPVGPNHMYPPNSRGRGRGHADRGGFQSPRRNNRAEFSQAGPNHDRSRTTIVVEQIPEENFSEESVKGFFSSFGHIEEVTMKPYKRLALVKFDSYDAAKAAYESPKVVFDNRFVKIYWYNPNSDQTAPNAGVKHSGSAAAAPPETPTFDREKFERETAEAQKRLEERKALQKQTETQLAEIQKQKEDLAKMQAETQQKLRDKLKAKGLPLSESNGTNGTGDKTNSKTEALRAQLKALETEAVSLGLDPEPWNSPGTSGRGRGRGRGSYRGWEGFRGGRGGFDPARGGYRGRGALQGTNRGSAAYNLDRRPKTIKVEGVTFDDEKDESLKQFLSSVGEFVSAESAESKTSETITFKDRKTAEAFFYGPRTIPGVGKLEFSWVQGAQPAVSTPSQPSKDDDTVMEGVNTDIAASRPSGEEDYQGHRDDDYDVAGDDDWIS